MPGGSTHRPGYVLAVFRRIGTAQGWGPSPPLCVPVVEAFVVAGLAGRAASTKGTYRSVLRSLGGSARPARATPFSGSPAKAPYTSKERQELFAIAGGQRQAWRRRSALALLALGIGAGLRPGELAAAVGDDVLRQPEGVAVRVGPGASCPSGARTRRPWPSWPNKLGRVTFSAPAGPTGPTRTSSTTSLTPWRRARLPPRFRAAGPALLSSATT
jgi:hypothetical protein